MAHARSSEPEEAEQLLAELPDLEVLGLLDGSSNYTFLARLEPHPPAGLLAVYKPARGESPLWDFEAGSLYRREVAAYELSKALFDVIVNNADRKSGHCLFDPQDEVWVIDHGLTFHVDQKLRTVIWDFSGEPLPQELCGDVERALAEVQRGPLGETLGGLLSPAEVRMLKRRLRGVLNPSWRFPEPTSAWSIPWPPI
jgi:hypothetical protein